MIDDVTAAYVEHRKAHQGPVQRSRAAKKRLEELIERYASPTSAQRDEVDYARAELRRLVEEESRTASERLARPPPQALIGTPLGSRVGEGGVTHES